LGATGAVGSACGAEELGDGAGGEAAADAGAPANVAMLMTAARPRRASRRRTARCPVDCASRGGDGGVGVGVGVGMVRHPRCL
jgi:hypothetical protein